MVIGTRKSHGKTTKSSFNVDDYNANEGRRKYNNPSASPFYRKFFVAFTVTFSVFVMWWTSSSSSTSDGAYPVLTSTQKKAFELTCSGFGNGSAIPMKYARNGNNLSPPLSWSGVPSNTKSFALIVDDPDAPTSKPWVHWIAYNLPPSLTSLSEGQAIAPPANEGLNSWKLSKYDGPQPPKGQNHLYVFTLYALDDMLFLDGNEEDKNPATDADSDGNGVNDSDGNDSDGDGNEEDKNPPTKEDLLQAMSGQILDQAKWTGRFGS